MAAIAAVAAVAVAVGAGLGAWWWSHPTSLRDGIGIVGVDARAADRTVYLEAFRADPEEGGIRVRVDRVAFARTDVRWAASDGEPTLNVRPLVCEATPGSVGIGAVGRLGPYCEQTRPLTPGTWVDGRGGREYVVLAVSLDGPGRVRVSDLEVAYRTDGSLARRGTQTLPSDLTVRLRR